MQKGIFLRRPNRFIAQVDIGGTEHTVHVKNTGRCRELLVPGAEVWCQYSASPARKTAYDLITVRKGERLINMDAQAPNRVFADFARSGAFHPGLTELKPEQRWGASRFDFAARVDGQPALLEIKGVTLEEDGVVRFPDAPTQRGARHLRELASAAGEGYWCAVVFVVQMADVCCFEPNTPRDPDFARALAEACAAGVHIFAFDCAVTEDALTVRRPVPLRLSGKTP